MRNPVIGSWLKGRRKRSRGFSLLELLVVMLIISVSMGVFLGYNYRHRDAAILRSTSGELQQFLRVCRGYAILEGRDNSCIYLQEEHRIREVLRGREMVLPEIVSVSLGDGDPLDAETTLAVFYGDGSALTKGIELQASAQKVLLTIDPILGEVNLER